MNHETLGDREKLAVIDALERALIDELITAGCTNSDAQGVVEAIIIKAT